jgi:hypothetical protein
MQKIIANTPNKFIFYLTFFCCLGLMQQKVFSQTNKKNPNGTTIISGKVTDAKTGDPIPYATVAVRGTTFGTNTDFDGFYKLTLAPTSKADSIVVTCVGYLSRAKKIEKGKTQIVNVQVNEAAEELIEVIITPKGYINPAWIVLDSLNKYKYRNDLRKLEAYQYEAYNRVELDVDNITEKFKKKKVTREILSLFDSAKRMAGDDGKPIIPIFVSETMSDFYYRGSPARTRENIKKQKITGIGIEDGSAVSQLVGATFLQYNFYQSWLSVGGKDFISPIADGGRTFYEYTLVSKKDYVDSTKCYKITFEPKRPQDLAFVGTMWITDSLHHFALKRIDAKIAGTANLNFIEQIKVQQELVQPDTSKAWLPSKTRVTVDIGDINDNWAGMLLKFYASHKNFTLDSVKPMSFFDQTLVVAEESKDEDPDYWNKNRHDSLTLEEKHVFHMIDTIKKLPTVRTYIEVADLVLNGYKRFGGIEFGNYLYTFAVNDVEGFRPRLGFRTNRFFSKKWTISGLAAYGTKDNRFKYEIGLDYLLYKKKWTQVGVFRMDDLDQVALLNESYANTTNNIFKAFVRWRAVSKRRPFYHEINRAYIQSDIVKGFTQKVTLSHHTMTPVTEFFDFAYIDPKDGEIHRNLVSTDLTFETRLAFNEKTLDRGNRRTRMGRNFKPVFLFRYTWGIPKLLGSQIEYHKFTLNIQQTIRMGALGRSQYSATAGYIPSKVPYPLLENHLGNQSIFYNSPAFNMMNYFEFTSDTFFDIRYEHHFEGLFLNSVPLLRKLKWRNFAGVNALWGSVRQENRDVIPQGIPSFNSLGTLPYVEVFYGVENIFKFIRVDFMHRVTYLTPEAPRFGVRLSAALSL